MDKNVRNVPKTGLLLIAISQLLAATPLPTEIIDFNDPWDYKLTPHSDPLIKQPSTYHNLPSTLLRRGKTNDFDYEEAEEREESKSPAEIFEAGSIMSKLSCSSCRLGLSLMRAEVNQNHPFEEIKTKFVGVCVGLKIEIESVCTGVFNTYAPVVLPALKEVTLETEKICSLLLGELCGEVNNPMHEWNIGLSRDNSEDIWSAPPPKEDSPTFKVLQLSDTHFDPDYQEGSPENCQEPLCCRNYSLVNELEVIHPAGKWGSYGKCDSPKALIENTLESISKQHPDIDYIIWTGDIPPHDVWNQTKEQNLMNIKYTVGKIFEYFPNIPVFPALGNHEGIPSGNFPPPWIKVKDQSIDWLYNEIANQWSRWLPTSVAPTVLQGGFYSVLIRPKFRLISINTNYCYALSWWLVLNSTDPAKELQWLVHELDMAEQNKEKVHIIGHIPPGSADCIKIWSNNYYNIINRYRNTVVAQFFGHAHTDEFEVFYDNIEYKNPIGIAYVGPSVTTYDYLNPGYRIYYVDGDHENSTREVIDHETWIMDLKKANNNYHGDPEWFKLYSARSIYGMNTLRPNEWDNLIKEMLDNPKLFNLFYKLSYKASSIRPSCTDPKCKFELICRLKSGRSHFKNKICKNEQEKLLGTS